MLRDLADHANAAGQTGSEVKRRYPNEQVLFATAATILETPHTAPTGWTLRRFLQRRGNVAITNARIFVQSSFWSPMTVLWMAVIGYCVYAFFWQGERSAVVIAVVGAMLLIQRRPYSRDLPFASIRGVQFGSVRGLTARGDIVAIALDRGAVQVVTAQFVPADLRERLLVIGGQQLPHSGAESLNKG